MHQTSLEKPSQNITSGKTEYNTRKTRWRTSFRNIPEKAKASNITYRQTFRHTFRPSPRTNNREAFSMHLEWRKHLTYQHTSCHIKKIPSEISNRPGRPDGPTVSLLDSDHVANNRTTPQTSRPYSTYQVVENTRSPVENPYMAQTIESHHRPGKNYALTRFQKIPNHQ